MTAAQTADEMAGLLVVSTVELMAEHWAALTVVCSVGRKVVRWVALMAAKMAALMAAHSADGMVASLGASTVELRVEHWAAQKAVY